jgi:DNA-binding MarR family transcriptional regulator
MSDSIDPDLYERRLREVAPGLVPGTDGDADAISMVLLLARLSGQLLNELDNTVHRPRGWSWSGFRIMLAVHVWGPLEPRQIAPLAGVTRASISAVLNTLERDGLVQRLRDSADRRIVTIVLTDLGTEKLRETYVEQHRVEREWAATLTSRERSQFIAAMRKMIAGRSEPSD